MPYLTDVSSLVCVLDRCQQQCANRGHLRVRLSPSAIHCCLPLDSFTPPPLVFFLVTLQQQLQLFQSVLFSLVLPLVLFLPTENKTVKKKKRLPPLAALRATYNADPLSKLLSFPLPPSFPATVGEELSHFLSFSSPCLALPLPGILFSVSFQHLLEDRKSLGTTNCCIQNGKH